MYKFFKAAGSCKNLVVSLQGTKPNRLTYKLFTLGHMAERKVCQNLRSRSVYVSALVTATQLDSPGKVSAQIKIQKLVMAISYIEYKIEQFGQMHVAI